MAKAIGQQGAEVEPATGASDCVALIGANGLTLCCHD